MGTSEFTGNSVLTKILDCDLEQSRCYPFYVSAGDTYAVKKGGAVHNKVGNRSLSPNDRENKKTSQ